MREAATLRWIQIAEVRVIGGPKGQPRARSRTGQIGVYDPSTAAAWRAHIGAKFEQQKPQRPGFEPVRIDVDFYFARPQKFAGRIGKALRVIYGRKLPDCALEYIKIPDLDNCYKAVLDELQSISYIAEDAIVCVGLIRQFYHAVDGQPGARIRIKVLRPVLEA